MSEGAKESCEGFRRFRAMVERCVGGNSHKGRKESRKGNGIERERSDGVLAFRALWDSGTR